MKAGGALYMKGLCKMLCKSEGLKVASAQKTKRSLIVCALYRKKNSPKKEKVSYLPKQSQVVAFNIYIYIYFAALSDLRPSFVIQITKGTITAYHSL